VRDQIGDVGELLFEIALVRLEPSEQLLPVRERSAEVEPTGPVVTVMHVHLLSS
jgi:hypothetical protein